MRPPGSGAAPAPEHEDREDQERTRPTPGYDGVLGFVLYGAGDVIAERAEALAWAAEIGADPPMTPWGPLRVVAAELREVGP